LDKVLDYLISFLKNKGHIVSTKDLSSPNVLVPLVVYLSREGWFEGPQEDKFLYWMYAALYQGRYTTSTDTYLQQDISALLEEPEPETLITALKEEEGSPEVSAGSLELRGVRNSLYNMMNIVIRARGAVDWSNGLPLEENFGRDFRIERHHIFPKSVLENNGWESGRSLSEGKKIHEIANRIPLTRDGNMDIFDKRPAEYLPMVAEKYPGTLEASLIPQNEKLWKVDNYEKFLQKRRELIAEAINDYMDSLLLEEGSEEFRIQDLIDREEDNEVEFKARLRAGDDEGGGYFLEDAAMKAITGFLNAEGGYLLIGVGDDGEIIGVEADYETLGKSNRDGFTLYLTDLIESKIGSDVLPLIDINIEEVDGKDVCLVEVEKSSNPVYLKKDNSEKFYVRMQNSTRELEGAEMDSYKEERFNL
ncbi:MAG: RNA-binding domain-containing protein, partial [Candidatus Magasanikbacteria bacterium]